MRNLAGDPMCDASIADELADVGVTVVESDTPTRGEVGARLTGRITQAETGFPGDLVFRRAWRYWIVDGLVPLRIARILYAGPTGQKYVRVAGHCACPPPDAWAVHFHETGKKLITSKSAGYPRPENPIGIMKHVFDTIDQDYLIVDDPAASAHASYVDTYHIDTMNGLRLFVDTIRRECREVNGSGIMGAP